MNDGHLDPAELARENEALRRQVATLQVEAAEERAAQQALAQSEAFNRTIVASIPQMLFLKDRSSVYLAVNERYATSLGHNPAHFVGKDDFAFYPTELAEQYRADDLAVMESGRVKELEERYIAQGKEHWAHTTKAPVRDAAGQVTALLGLFEDITERKRVEHSLKEARDRLAEAQRAGHLGNWEWDAVNDQITGSEEFYRLFDVAPDGIARFAQFVERLHPGDRERVQQDVADALKQNRPYDTDYRVKLSDGGWRDIIARGRVFASPDGRPERMVGTCLDITERKRAEEALRESEARNRATLYSIGDAVIATDAQSRISQMNPVAQTLTGWGEAEALGQPLARVFRIVNEDTRAEIESPAERVLREGVVIGLANHTLLIAKDGSERPIADSGAPIRDEHGEVTGVVLVFRDQTEERAAQRALEQSERRYRTLALSLPHLVWTCRADGPCDYLSPRWVEYTGIPEAQQLGYRWLEQLHPDDRDRVIAEWSEVAPRGGAFDIEFRIRRADGVHRWFKTRAIPFVDDDGHVVKWFGSNTDIDDHKRSHEALRESEEKYRGLFDNAEVGMYRSRLDGSGIVALNQRLADIFGFTKEEMLSSPATMRWADAKAREAMVRLLREHGELRDYELDIVTKGGAIRTVLASMKLYPGQGYLEGTAIDITERKQMEARVIHLNLVLQAIRNVNQLIVREKEAATLIRRSCEVLTETRGYSSAWIALYDESGEYRMAASAGIGGAFEALEARIKSGQLAGCRRALGEGGLQIVSHPSLQCPGCPAATLYADGSAIAVRLEHEGQIHGLLVMSMAAGLVDVEEERSLIEEVADDIAYALHGLQVEHRRGVAVADLRRHRDELERRVQDRTAQLEESNKELEAFSYSVSHDLRAPLRAIDGFTRIITDDYGALFDAEGRRLCSIIHDNTAKMGQLIDDLLAFSRLGRAAMNLSRIDMAAMATSVFYELTTPEDRARIDLRVGALLTAVADPTLMRQVWANLLSNAIKFSGKRERAMIAVEAEQRGGEAVYAVKDNGAGFEMQYVDKLFGVFQRLHSSREFEGTGVGLALVQRVVRRHGGRVWAEGAPNQGATFYFALRGEER